MQKRVIILSPVWQYPDLGGRLQLPGSFINTLGGVLHSMIHGQLHTRAASTATRARSWAAAEAPACAEVAPFALLVGAGVLVALVLVVATVVLVSAERLGGGEGSAERAFGDCDMPASGGLAPVLLSGPGPGLTPGAG